MTNPSPKSDQSDHREGLFDTLYKSGDYAAAQDLAFKQIGKGVDVSDHLEKLARLYVRTQQPDRLIGLFDTYAEDKRLASYSLQVMLATTLLASKEQNRARAVLLTLIYEHHFVVPLRLYARLPNSGDDVELAIASFNRSLRPQETRLAQGTALVDVAAAAGKYELARTLLRGLVKSLRNASFSTAPKSSKHLDPSAGAVALVDLHDLLVAECPFFLDGGTLLSIYRDGHLLNSDNCIAIGVLGDQDMRTALSRSDLFTLDLSAPSWKTRATHKNGVLIEIANYHPVDDQTRSGDGAHAWNHRSLPTDGAETFADLKFGDKSYLVPAQTELFLSEIYGDWRSRNADFDMVLDAHNRVTDNHDLSRIRHQAQIIDCYITGDTMMMTRYLSAYGPRFGVNEFLNDCRLTMTIGEPR